MEQTKKSRSFGFNWKHVCVRTRLTFKEIIAKIIWLAELRALIEKRLLFRILFSSYSAAYTKRWWSIVRKYELLFCNMLPQKICIRLYFEKRNPNRFEASVSHSTTLQGARLVINMRFDWCIFVKLLLF